MCNADDIRRCQTGINTGRTTADDQEDEAMQSLPHEASEVRKLLDELDSTEQWLQNLEDLLSEPTAMRSPQVIRKDLRNIAVLEKEVKSRGMSVHSLRNRARGPKVLEGRKNEEMEEKVQEVEERFRMVQDVLRRRVSDLRDSLVLSEFMKVVQMEEEKRNKELLGSGAPAREGPQVTEADDSGREIFTPLEELQEAVEMLNEAVKERERMVTVTKETENLEKRLSVVVRMVNCAKCRLNKLKMETEEAEQSYVVMRHQEELTDLQGLFIQQQDLEAEICGALKLEVRRLEEHTDQLHDMSLEKAKVIGQLIQDTLQAWSQLEKKVHDNKTRLQRTSQLRRFFQCYLAMISWTEDTRTHMLLGNPEEPVGSVRREELEQNIEEKLREFEELASVGWKFIGEEHELTQTIRERLEEVQGMLSWVLMRWRCQKHQMVAANKTERRKTKEAAPEMSQVLTTEPPLETSHQDSPPEVCESDTCVPPPARTSRPRRYERQAHSPMSLQHHLSQLATDIQKESQLRGDQEGTPGPKRSEGPLWLEPREPPVGAESVEQEETVYTPPPTKSSGLATFWKRCQGLLGNKFSSLKRKNRVSLPSVEEVRTFLHVNKSEQPQLNACYSLTVPRPSKKALAVDRFSLPTKSAIGTPSGVQPKIKSCSLFNSLKRKEKTQRRTVQGIMGLYPNDDPAKKVSKYHTHTWPPRQHRKVSHRELSPELSKLQHYVKNPLESDINDECVTSGPVLQKADINKSFHFGSPMLTSGCRHVALGSVFSVELAKDAISTQQTFKVPTKESDSNGSSGEDLTSVRVFDSLKTNVAHETESTKPCTGGNQTTKQDLNTQGGKAWPEELTSSPGYCRQNLHGYGNPNSQQQERPTEHMVSLGINRSSPLTLSNEPLEPNGYHAKMLINKHRSNNVSNSFATNSKSPSRYHSEDVIYSTSNVCEAEELVQYAEFSFTKEEGNESLVDTFHNSYLEPINTSTETIRHNYNSPGSYSTQRNPAVTIGTSSLPEVLHPDHEFLEQDDEELEGIWNNAKMGVENCTTQDSYITLHKTGDSRNMAKPADIWTIKKPPIVTVSKPNMLVATFTLPNSALLSVDTEKQRGIKVTEEQHIYGHGDGASHQKVSQTCRGSTPDPRPADPCKEEETKRKKQTSALNLFHKLDFQLMEGPLEKKHILQQGGKKASCRTWSMCHVVLVRRTLCFYNDRKHPTKSSASAPPLHLTGAVCTPETDYTKRDNCFRLRLYDGSEYLLRAPSPALLQEWVSKVQHNAGLEDRDLLGDTALGGDITTSPSRSLLSYRIPDLCQPIPVFDREKLEKAHREHLEPTNQRVGIQQDPCRTGAHPARSQLQFLSPAESCRTPDSCGQEDDLALVANRRRSRSFSSAVYQKMSSFSSPQKTSPSYSVTLYITDPPAPRGRSHSFAAGLEVSHLERSGQGSHAGVLKPRNKSVFRKLFRKKD
ncbi:uncharacterized protein LOC128658211 isoform X2 [Bombina bombina]|uniref:uncharacterized protein LOC128658211 isoform X2 n=1 Tax=Bombina bombina TaxID=8345 RepID=UPI00235A9346|nr:uncharacterized protein LOC128658211 isoform X2 [Bombina bombina]